MVGPSHLKRCTNPLSSRNPVTALLSSNSWTYIGCNPTRRQSGPCLAGPSIPFHEHCRGFSLTEIDSSFHASHRHRRRYLQRALQSAAISADCRSGRARRLSGEGQGPGIPLSAGLDSGLRRNDETPERVTTFVESTTWKKIRTNRHPPHAYARFTPADTPYRNQLRRELRPSNVSVTTSYYL